MYDINDRQFVAMVTRNYVMVMINLKLTKKCICIDRYKPPFSGFHSGDGTDCNLMVCDTVLHVKRNVSEEHSASIFREDQVNRGSIFLRIFCFYLQDYTVLHPTRP
jgi:hypothetical protein